MVKALSTLPPAPPGSLAEAQVAAPEPRRTSGWRPAYPPNLLVALLQVTVAAMLCGSVGQTAIAQRVRQRAADDPALLTTLGLPAGRVPWVAAFNRLFKALDVAAFERALRRWLPQTGIAPGEALAVDGTVVRGVERNGVPGVYLLSVSARAAETVIAQLRTAGTGGVEPRPLGDRAPASLAAGRDVRRGGLPTRTGAAPQVRAACLNRVIALLLRPGPDVRRIIGPDGPRAERVDEEPVAHRARLCQRGIDQDLFPLAEGPAGGVEGDSLLGAAGHERDHRDRVEAPQSFRRLDANFVVPVVAGDVFAVDVALLGDVRRAATERIGGGAQATARPERAEPQGFPRQEGATPRHDPASQSN